ncbi:hypothetical protein VNO78_02681 [Psophocarpus tetragonolobus]|uniref:Uncharacterized protein n=1 Tax=Psophocarpus tetragonolobus TaxID=3891 RepID=A0AAN9T091_PSOTE
MFVTLPPATVENASTHRRVKKEPSHLKAFDALLLLNAIFFTFFFSVAYLICSLIIVSSSSSIKRFIWHDVGTYGAKTKTVDLTFRSKTRKSILIAPIMA